MIGVAVGVGVVLLLGLFFVFRRGGSASEAPPDSSAGWTLALRVEGSEDEEFARDVVARLGGDCRSRMAEVALEMLRLAPGATHFYAGTARALRCDLPGGAIVKLELVAPRPAIDDLRDVMACLRTLDAPRSASLALTQSWVDGQPLVAVDDDDRPGHRRCAFCRHSFVLSEFECPSCGAPVSG